MYDWHKLQESAALPQPARCMPPSLVCLQVVMVKPVIAADGHAYERAALEEWLLQHVTSPVTGDFLAHMRIVPNVLIRSAIETNRAGCSGAHS